MRGRKCGSNTEGVEGIVGTEVGGTVGIAVGTGVCVCVDIGAGV